MPLSSSQVKHVQNRKKTVFLGKIKREVKRKWGKTKKERKTIIREK